MVSEVSKGKPVGPGAKMESLTKVMGHNLAASRKFRRSMDELEGEGSVSGKQVCDIFKSQAELNQINLAWHSFTSLSLIHNQGTIKQLQGTVAQQSAEIENQGYRLDLHQKVIRKLFGALLDLGQKYRRLSEGQGKTLGMLRVLQAQVMVAVNGQQTSSVSARAADMFRSSLSFLGRYGLLALVCDSVLSLTRISAMLHIVTQLMVYRRNSARAYGIAKATAILSMILLLRNHFEKLLSLLNYLLRTIINAK